MKKIYVSPSNQTRNTYAAGNTTEAVQCCKIATALVVALKRCGFDAKTNVNNISMSEKVKESNNFGADLHMPIHTNAFNGKVKGTRMFVSSLSSSAYKVCQEIAKTLNPITPGESDAIREYPELYEIRNTKAPCAYLEVAFHDNVEEAKWIINNIANIAEAICKGLCNYYGVKYVAVGENIIPDPIPTPTPTPAKQLYRVRKTWADSKSQIGAYSSLDNAKVACDKAGSGYYVFDESGKAVYPVAVIRPTLRNGSTGEAVKTLQARLNELGYSCGTVDGIFGAKTVAAVKSFQTVNGLAVDGIVGNQTWAALDAGSAAYQVKVTADALNVRSGPGTGYKIVDCIRDHGIYTITEVNNGWGHLKSKAGWIYLQYTKKV